MRLTARLVLALAASAALVVVISTFLEVRQERARLLQELERRSHVLAEGIRSAIEPRLARGDGPGVTRLLEDFSRHRDVAGIAVFSPGGELLNAAPAGEAPRYRGLAARASETVRAGRSLSTFDSPAERVVFLPLGPAAAPSGALAVLPDASFVDGRIALRWTAGARRLSLHLLLIVIVSLWFVRGGIANPVAQLADWMRQARSGRLPPLPSYGVLGPVADEAARLARSLTEARTAAEEEARLRHGAQSLWTPERLKEHVRVKLGGRPLFVVANREPYMHVRRGKSVGVLTPASGLVTGIEPILRACGGLWLAHGAGDADRETADGDGKLRVPPDDPQYTLKRVWLTPEEERGYYYGFSNEGLWPLCHIAHTRPLFAADDWAQYQSVNRRFADSLLAELEGTEEPFVLIQDYHYALLPRMIKDARPDARVALFWHIPWPNPEAFGICPWQREILHGMLGADIVGFHIQAHCNNFLETVDAALESRIEWERFAVQRGGHSTAVRPYPISIDFAAASAGVSGMPSRQELLRRHGLEGAQFLAVGVDRVDYTKGIVERFRGVERFLEKYPEYQGHFTFVELGAPSRTNIPRYGEFLARVEAEAARVNARFPAKGAPAILLRTRHHSHAEIAPFYRAADLCLVTSLHDGMNLVAKEFVASRSDDGGCLILSRFTGAARELREAFIINPYDTEQLAEAIRAGLTMHPDERLRRMASMRQVLREHNIYLWASRVIEELSAVRLPVSA